MVGDDDQAIYGWRGADVRLLLDFQHDWPDAEIVKLEENYRSSQVILDAAHAVVACNESARKAAVYAARRWRSDHVFQAAMIALKRGLSSKASCACRPKNYFPEDFAVIYRTNAQSLRFEETPQAVGLPFRCSGRALSSVPR